MPFNGLVITTATPLINSAQDCLGYLKMLWNNKWELHRLNWIIKEAEFNIEEYYKVDANLEDFRWSVNDPTLSMDLLESPESVVVPSADQQAFVDACKSGEPLHLLNPLVYREIYRRMENDAQLCQKILSVILCYIQTRRLLSTPIPDGRAVQRTVIPTSEIKTISLTFEREETAKEYSDILDKLKPVLLCRPPKKNKNRYETAREEVKFMVDFETGKMDANILRLLNISTTHADFFKLCNTRQVTEVLEKEGAAIFNSFKQAGRLFDLPSRSKATDTLKRKREDKDLVVDTSYSGGTVDDVTAMRESDPHGGLGYFWLAICKDSRIPYPSGDPSVIICFFIANSPKYAYLLKHAFKVCRLPQIQAGAAAKAARQKVKALKHKRLVVFFNNPLTQAFGEAVLELFGFQIRSLRANMDSKTRSTQIAEFNDSETSVEILVTSLRLSSQGLNLHKQCHHMLIVEPPKTINEFLQAQARIARLGQANVPKICLLRMDQSFDDYEIARAFRKYIAQWAAETPLKSLCTGPALHLLGYELVRAKLGFPYVPFDVDLINAKEVSLAVQFAHAITPHISKLRDPDVCQKFNADFAEAKSMRSAAIIRLRRLWIANGTSNPLPQLFPVWLERQVSRYKRVPFLPSEFRLIRGDDEPGPTYDLEDDLCGPTETQLIFIQMKANSILQRNPEAAKKRSGVSTQSENQSGDNMEIDEPPADEEMMDDGHDDDDDEESAPGDDGIDEDDMEE
ncbi:MAG: hypothetical protein Q9190_007514 [Brigantiaea leucoxantha]